MTAHHLSREQQIKGTAWSQKPREGSTRPRLPKVTITAGADELDHAHPTAPAARAAFPSCPTHKATSQLALHRLCGWSDWHGGPCCLACLSICVPLTPGRLLCTRGPVRSFTARPQGRVRGGCSACLLGSSALVCPPIFFHPFPASISHGIKALPCACPSSVRAGCLLVSSAFLASSSSPGYATVHSPQS